VLLALLPATAWATYPGANGRIAYSGFTTGGPSYDDDDIYSVLPDGTSRRQLTTNPNPENSPAWSANGRRLAFVRTLDGRSQIFTIRADGGDETQVTHQRSYVFDPYFSPNGRRIVYTVGSNRILKIRSDGTHRRRIVSGKYLLDPAYSPSGERIVFGGAPEGRSAGIWTVHPDGSHLRRLTPPGHPGFCGEPEGPSFPCLDDASPDYSPDGSHIAFSHCDYGYDPSAPNCDIHLMRANGSYLHSIRHADRTYIYPLSYSPAGDRIAFDSWPVSYAPDAPGSTVYTITPTGADLQPVTDSQHGVWSLQPSWQPLPGS
jgi:Tol biopolymer transport system component